MLKIRAVMLGGVFAVGTLSCSEEPAEIEDPTAAALPCETAFDVVVEEPTAVVISVGESAEFYFAVGAPCEDIQVESRVATPPFWAEGGPVYIGQGLMYRDRWGLDGTEPGTFSGELTIPVRVRGVVDNIVLQATVEVVE